MNFATIDGKLKLKISHFSSLFSFAPFPRPFPLVSRFSSADGGESPVVLLFLGATAAGLLCSVSLRDTFLFVISLFSEALAFVEDRLALFPLFFSVSIGFVDWVLPWSFNKREMCYKWSF